MCQDVKFKSLLWLCRTFALKGFWPGMALSPKCLPHEHEDLSFDTQDPYNNWSCLLICTHVLTRMCVHACAHVCSRVRTHTHKHIPQQYRCTRCGKLILWSWILFCNRRFELSVCPLKVTCLFRNSAFLEIHLFTREQQRPEQAWKSDPS